MTYVMEKALVDYILAQHAEADEFMKTPGNWMGKMPSPSETKYWSERVPSGTLAEFQRTELEEAAYYMAADAMSKSYARYVSPKLSEMTDQELEDFCTQMGLLMKADAERAEEVA